MFNVNGTYAADGGARSIPQNASGVLLDNVTGEPVEGRFSVGRKTFRMLLGCLSCAQAFAQLIVTGTIAGAVVDPSGQFVPAAGVRAANESTRDTRSALTGDTVFNLLALPPATTRSRWKRRASKLSSGPRRLNRQRAPRRRQYPVFRPRHYGPLRSPRQSSQRPLRPGHLDALAARDAGLAAVRVLRACETRLY